MPDAAFSHVENQKSSFCLLSVITDYIQILLPGGNDPLGFFKTFQSFKRVPPAGSLFKPQFFGSLFHFLFQLTVKLEFFPLQQQQRPGDIFAVLRGGNEAGAGGSAEFQVIFQTGSLTVAEDSVLAGAQLENFGQETDEFPGFIGRAEGPEVSGSIIFHPAAQINSWKLFVQRYFDKREAFVIFQPQVEARLVKLNVIVFDETGFFFRAHQKIINVGGFAQNILNFNVRGGEKIAFNSVPQRSGFSDVDDFSLPVFEEINSRSGWKFFDFLLQLFQVHFSRFIDFLYFLYFHSISSSSSFFRRLSSSR